MKTVIRLVYDLPRDKEEMNITLNAAKYYCAITALDTWLRNLAKYEEKEMVDIKEVRAKIREELNDE